MSTVPSVTAAESLTNLTSPSSRAEMGDLHQEMEDEFFFCRNLGNSTTPLSNECFVDGLRLIPNGFLILTSLPILIAWRKSQSEHDHTVTWVHFPRHTLRWVLSLLLIILGLLQFSEALVSDSLHQGTRLRIIMPNFISLLASVLSITYYHYAELSNSPRFLLLLIPYWGSSLAVDAMKVVNMDYKGLSFVYLRPILTRAGIAFYSTMLLIEFDVLRILRYAFFKKTRTLYPPEDLDRITYLHSYVSFISQATFQWIFKILTTGYKRPLELIDLGLMPKEESSATNYAKLTRAIEAQKRRGRRLPSLWRVYWAAFWPWMLVAAGLRLLGDLLTFVGPLLLGGIIMFVERRVQEAGNNATALPMQEQFVTVYDFFTNGYIMALLLFIATLLMNTCLQAQHFIAVREGVRLRGAIQMLVYKKTLSLSMRTSDPRKMLSRDLVDHMTVDANNLFFYMYTFNLVWALPLKVTVAFCLLYYFLGRSTLFAAGIIILLSAVQFIFSHILAHMKHTYKVHCDARLSECNNLFSAIKLVKVYAWEPWFRRDIAVARKKQAAVMAKMACIKAASMFITEATPVLVTLVAFAMYPYIESTPLTPSIAFTSLALFDILGLPLTLFPILIDFLKKARRSTGKLHNFLAQPEIRQNRPLCPWYGGFSKDGSEGKDSSVRFELGNGAKVSIIETAASPQTTSPVHGDPPQAPYAELPDVTKLDHSPTCLRKKLQQVQSEGEEHELEVICELEEENPDESERERLLPDISPGEEEKPETSDTDAEAIEVTEKKRHPLAKPHSLRLHENYSRQHSSTISSNPGSVIDDDSVDLNRDKGVAVDIKDGYFCWDGQDEDNPHLSNINFKADAGCLTMIVGEDHSGKSSLLASLLGEMTKIKGAVVWKSGISVAYVAENPWLLNTTLQQNILFGRPMEKKRYKRVINACGLQPDIDILPEGEHTLIGEQGLGLSRGQRQRVSLARAMYSRADVLLLDQPFAPLDLATSAHVFEQGILRWVLKRKRTVILITHQLQYLAFADMVYRLEKGQITHRGHLQEIKLMDPQLFARWRNIVREERKELAHVGAEENTKTKADRSKLRRKISTMEFQREMATSVVAVGDDRGDESGKEVLMNQQFAQMSFFSDTQADVENKPVSSQPTDHQMELEADIPDLIMEQEKPDRKPKRSLSKLISNKDERVHGVLNFDLMWLYIQACSVLLTVVVMVLQVSRTTLSVSADFWLAFWTTAEYQKESDNSTMTAEETQYYIHRYIGISTAAVVLSIAVVLAMEYTGYKAALKLHSHMADHIIFAPMKFFDTTPISQILNRFSADVNTVDDKLPTTMEHFLRTQLMCMSALIVNCVATPWYLVVIILVIFSYYSVQKFFRASAREFLKLDNLSKPPIIAHFTETVLGLPVIRAYRDEVRFLDIMHKHIDLNTLAFLWMHTANRWMGLRMEHLASCMVFGSAVAAITVGCGGLISPGVVGLAIAYTLMMLSYSNFVVRSGADTELQLHAVERVYGYTRIDTEEDIQGDILGEEVVLPDNWPTSGDVRFVGVSLKYDTAPSPILRDISFHLAPKQKIGVCGTDHGSGKSSLALGLWRLLDTSSGHIYIDGFDIRRIPLTVLRSRITLVPQDPTLLNGSIRLNLDPSGQCPDSALWQTLEKSGIKDHVASLPLQLDASPECFSSGQKQLLCIARALLRKTRILVLDQIVSFVDIETEEIIHNVIDTQLKDVTLIHIAHNASWLMSYDQILVLRRGYMVETGTPQRLMDKKDSIFRLLVKKSHRKKSK